jgi:glycine/D-amino acid oxidase-like deaminating enzyme
LNIEYLNDNPSPRRIIIVGGGIVGAALAFHLSKAKSEHHIVLIDKSLDNLLGSTGHAPGFVGQLNESPVLTQLAKDTVQDYLTIPGGFETVGGLEISSTESGLENLKRRQKTAQEAGLPAELLAPEAAASLAPDFIDANSAEHCLHFPSDGTANAGVITSYYVDQARTRGVDFLEAAVTGLKTKKNDEEMPEIMAIQTASGDIRSEGSTVVLATGIWTSALISGDETPVTQLPIPIVPVAHPYTFTSPRPRRAGTPYPFVRWLDHHVYARDHGDRDGLGSYDHPPMRLDPSKSAIGAWPPSFDQVLSDASSKLKNGTEFQVHGQSVDSEEPWAAEQPFNGIFSVTPDNLPFAGPVPDVTNLWLAAAIWVTTAAGTAKLLAREILGNAGRSTASADKALMDALSPARFQGVEEDLLVRQSLGKYNDIYNRET